MKNPEITVQVDDTMPLGELLEEAKDPNMSIKRSAHIGNMFGADLILASMGMNMLLVDANYGDKDKLYYPQLIVDEHLDPVEVACSRTLSLANTASCGTSLNDLCVEALVKAFGNASILPDRSFVAANQELIERIVGVLLAENADMFTREIDSTGRPIALSRSPSNIDQVLLLGRERMTGAVIPNAMNILIDFVVESINKQTDSITHISGPTMVKYLSGIMPLINTMYEQLKRSGLGLPDVLKVRLVPAAGVRFVVSASQADTLDELIETQSALSDITSRVSIIKKELAMSGTKPRKQDFDAISAPQKSIERELGHLARGLPQLFYVDSPTSNTPTFTSQTTALRNGADGTPGSGLYIPSIALEQPISDVSARFKQLDILRAAI
jgi:hypothetical protein